MVLSLCHAWYRGQFAPADSDVSFYLPSVREGVDIQDALLFSKPDWGLDGSAISFITLQVEVPLSHKEGEVWAMHGNTFMVSAVEICAYNIVPGIRIPSVLHTAVGEHYGTESRDESLRTPASAADAD